MFGGFPLPSPSPPVPAEFSIFPDSLTFPSPIPSVSSLLDFPSSTSLPSSRLTKTAEDPLLSVFLFLSLFDPYPLLPLSVSQRLIPFRTVSLPSSGGSSSLQEGGRRTEDVDGLGLASAGRALNNVRT